MSKKNKKRRVGLLKKLLPDELTVKSAAWGLAWLFVTSLLTTMLSDFFAQCKIVILSTSSRIGDRIVDSFYEMMARSSELDSMFEATLTWKLMGFLFVAYTAANALGRARGIFANVAETRRRNGLSAEELKKSNENGTKEWVRRRERVAQTLLRLGKIQFAFGAAYAVLITFQIGSGLFVNECVKEFRRELTIVRPLISDLDYYTLERDWVLIKTKSDYKALLNKINRLKGASENLPLK